MRFRRMVLTAGLVSIASPLSAGLAAQTADTSWFVTTQGKDTIAIEQYVRAGNTITGAWIQHQGAVYWHDYVLVLRNDGWPDQYVMTLYTTRPHTFLMSVTYGPDSATRIVVRDSTAVTQRVSVQRSYPVGALSMVGMELALARARRSNTDSTTIILDRAETRGSSPSIPVKFFGADSARVGATTWARLDRSGRLIALRDGSLETRRVPSLAVATLTAGFYAADSAARAARVAITLPPSALQRFVGEYSLPTAVLAITVEDGRLALHVGKQPPTRLSAASPTTFFNEGVLGLTFEFETDASGNVTALSVVQGTTRQRAAKTK